MRKEFVLVIVILICCLFALTITACDLELYDEKVEGCESMNRYYSIEDFETITIGKSTIRDVYEIAPSDSAQLTSYGGLCEYPTEDGNIIRVKFYGSELVVGTIEVE